MRICLLVLGPIRDPFVSICRATPSGRATQFTTIGLLLLSAIFVPPPPAIAQTGGYSVTATLDPFFIHPVTGEDFTNGALLRPFDGLVRGADGWLYGLSKAREGQIALEIIQVNPATGAARVLYALTGSNLYPSQLRPGLGGRLYFTVRDYIYSEYGAPGQPPAPYDFGSWGGWVLFIDTAANGQLRALNGDFQRFETGWYLHENGDGIFVEDIDGAIYVDTTSNAICRNGQWPHGDGGALVKIAMDGTDTVLEVYGCDEPEFDWSTVTPSSVPSWQWSDGRTYWVSGQGVYQYDPQTNTTMLLANIAATDGAPLEWLAEGSGYLYGMTCCGGALNGGVVFRIRVPSLASPDLIVTAVSDPPASSAPGRSFSVTDTTRNDAKERAASSATSHYLSFTGESADIKLANSRYLLELGRFEESSGSVTVMIPATAPVGTYWLVSCADAKLQVAEGDDLNNCRASATTILLSRPDLTQSAISNPPAIAQPGGAFTVTDTVQNVGGASAAASSTRYYFSTDAIKGAGDVLLTGTRSVPILAPSIESTGNRALTIPAATPLATYHVLACADDLKKVSEANEGNNCRASTSRVVVARADLITSTVNNPPAQTAPGRTFSMSDTVVNQGQASAAASSTRYYFSLDPLKNAGDMLLTGTRAVPLLVAGATATGPRTVTVPSTVPAGTYRVLACADDTAKVSEALETNNCKASTGTVQVLYPDLAQLAVSNPPATAAIGGTFSVTDTVANQGAIATSTTKTSYYLSLDTVKGAGDVLLGGSRSVGSVAAGGQNTGARVVTIPTLPAGAYYLLACADGTKLAVESNEGNNCKHAAATITIHQ
jgi:subtilase family serine protease